MLSTLAVLLIKRAWDSPTLGEGAAVASIRRHPAPSHGSRHVFIDVGGNVGDSIAAFLTVGVPGVARPGGAFDAVYVFEPNPEFAPRYDRYRGKRYAFEFLPAAAAAHDGYTKFDGSGLGGSVLAQAAAGEGATRTIDFSAWLQHTVAPEDFVVCKIDAEGSEFEIVQRMAADGTLCLCDRLSIEWHAWLGTRSPPSQHVRAFLDPDATTERFDEGCTGSNCYCSIPHMELELPFFYCGLPYSTKWLRQACALDGAPPLEHHEAWKGWEHVGRPDAFTHYPATE
jgi:FkbM family methyltransferase